MKPSCKSPIPKDFSIQKQRQHHTDNHFFPYYFHSYFSGSSTNKTVLSELKIFAIGCTNVQLLLPQNFQINPLFLCSFFLTIPYYTLEGFCRYYIYTYIYIFYVHFHKSYVQFFFVYFRRPRKRRLRFVVEIKMARSYL